MHRYALVYLICIPVLLAACVSPVASAVTPRLSALYTSAQCRGLSPAADVAELTPAQWQAFRARQEGGTISDPEDGQRLIVVNMGERRTGGYGVTLGGGSLEQGALTLTVHWRIPQPGMMLIQVITHPCLVVAVEGGRFDTVRVVDQDGALRLQAAVPSGQ